MKTRAWPSGLFFNPPPLSFSIFSFFSWTTQARHLSLSMNPVYLNPPTSSPFPVVELREDQQHLQLFLSPHHAAASLSSSVPDFLNATHDHYQREAKLVESHQHDHEDDKYISHSRWSDHFHKPLSFQAAAVNESSSREAHKLSSCNREDGDFDGSGGEGSAAKYMPSKMRLTQKMMNSNCSETDKPVKFTLNFQDQQCHTNNNYINVRVCADCSTTTTPLWRSGPLGPKSLCNACGIRQRKARRAMEAAAAVANGTVISMETSSSSSSSSTKSKLHKEKKSRTGHTTQGKKLWKPPGSPQGQKKICSFKNLALSLSKNPALQRVFPQDVEEAAILLMRLSCGFIHS
ncbi:hypothetical protein P3X46_007409 [Hevea brasiliensis]|uniref:GATA-type domain-containing protein n=1 Tax=Hevea brasiliensis TaxID=3981 RepID=A0ABQ9MTF4_HEVBR|nr:GATA transcription factor 21 [Hevea brasiliensis]KAJ9183572.1 hypothetical protein P3X46_007409 [Hevea brasiliensis]